MSFVNCLIIKHGLPFLVAYHILFHVIFVRCLVIFTSSESSWSRLYASQINLEINRRQKVSICLPTQLNIIAADCAVTINGSKYFSYSKLLTTEQEQGIDMKINRVYFFSLIFCSFDPCVGADGRTLVRKVDCMDGTVMYICCRFGNY